MLNHLIITQVTGSNRYFYTIHRTKEMIIIRSSLLVCSNRLVESCLFLSGRKKYIFLRYGLLLFNIIFYACAGISVFSAVQEQLPQKSV